ncbi:hypothetical protein ALC56_07243 [Trachymyrmex septentrionalis]|uniref:Uncharacterized protein n=1 Tax=Trachymyrmex septentrionalis TaxID=34720 RepID=A0A195FCR8_9HYME|nr:hypothetical protein ALC56_07243 [Trachymyrmex septentrionalis]
MSTSTYPTLAYALIVAGVLAVIGSWLGCGGVTSENRCILLVVREVLELAFDLTHSLLPPTLSPSAGKGLGDAARGRLEL